jgi:hypothetical protein
MRRFIKALLARDMQQILGADGETPCDFVVCWTPDGLDSGGTGYAIRCATDYGIPVYNVQTKEGREGANNVIRGLSRK